MTGRVLINARVAKRATITGVERWTLELTPRLRALAPGHYPVAHPPPVASSRTLGHAWEQLVLPAAAWHHRAGLIFSPANLAPVAWTRNVVLVHDAAPFRMPDAYSRSYLALHRSLGAASARRALQVVTVSEFSKRELVELLGLDPTRVRVIRGGVGAQFSPQAAADSERVKAKLGLRGRYVLTIGTADGRKNLGALDQAAGRLIRDGVEVVRAGDARPQFASTRPVAGVRSLGYIAESDLPGLYAGAGAFVLPSRYEGLGLPCLEAMACGVPVVAADRGALPETCGDAALLVDPDDGEAVAFALETVLDDETTRDRLRATGRHRAAEFSWDRAAAELHALLSELL
jgi:glycosyltransferase involved in cell wall biosynthesis